MKLKEKIDKISQTSKLALLPNGTAANLDEFWNTFIEPLLPSKQVVEGWHKLLLKYIKENDAIFSIRAFGSYLHNQTKDRKTLRRGFFNITNISLGAFYSDNFITSFFFSMAYDGYVPSYEDFKNMMLSRKFPSGYIMTTTEKQYAAFTKGKDPKIQSKGYKIAHIHATGYDFNVDKSIDTIGKFCNKYFPRGNYYDWKSIGIDKYGQYHFRKIAIDLAEKDKVRKFLIAHFLRTVHPINYFLVPKRGCISFVVDGEKKDEIGEYSALVRYVKQKIKKRYGKIYDQYLSLIKPVDDAQSTQENIQIDAVYGFGINNKEKIKKVKKTTKNGVSGIGKLVREKLIPSLGNGKVSSDEIKKFQTKKYSKNIFDINYPLLSKSRFDNNGRPRYYVLPVRIAGKDWYVCQEWYKKNHDKLSAWLKLHKIS